MVKKVSTKSIFLSDNETRVDLLSNEAIATTIIELLIEHPDRPVTIGVHGDWGAGKSSVLEMIEDKLAEKDGVLCLKFNGWRFQGFEDAKIALLEGIVTGLLEKRPKLTKAVSKVKDIFHRIDWLKVAKHAGSLAFTAYTGIPTIGQIQTILSTFETMFRDPSKRPPKADVDAAFENVYSLFKSDTPSRNVPEEIGEFRKAFDDLLKEAQIDRLIVLVDDLDRCLPDTAIETLEAIRLFVFTSHTAFVVAADEAMIEYAVRKHFPDLPNTSSPQTYARNYLEKLIQIPFRIPPLGVPETQIYVTLLLVGSELGDDDPDFTKLISASRERLRRPWSGMVIDSELIRLNLGDKARRVSHMLNLSDQIGPILANGTKGNPRQIKRFLNTLMLRKHTADVRGFGDDIKLPVLAKLMLAEQYMSPFFEQIAVQVVTSPNGFCADLKTLETNATLTEKLLETGNSVSKSTIKGGRKTSTETSERKNIESTPLNQWMATEWIVDWSKILPPLADIDLRPYLFIAKDKKDYFGATTALGHLASITEQLFRPKILVQTMEDDLKRLAIPEAIHIFETVRIRIISTDSFREQPDGIDGLTVLVKAQPTLQSNLLDFLEGLPGEHLGLWVVQGWSDVIKDTEFVARFDRLLKQWSSNTENPALKTAATAIMKLSAGGR